MMLVRSSLYCILCVLPLLCLATLTPKSKSREKDKDTKIKPERMKNGPQNYSVFDRKLIAENPTAKEIVLNHQAYYADTNKHNFHGLVLGYVTPWNSHGYDVAKTFANKFTHISPVWLQVVRHGDESYEIAGTHDIDTKWVEDVKKAGAKRGVKIVPRVLFEAWSGQDYMDFFSVDQEQLALAQTLIQTCRKYKFDGFVIEIWLQFGGRVQSSLMIHLVRQIATALKNVGLELILVVPPTRENKTAFDSIDYEKLYDYVAGFSLMTYDYSTPHRPGPNSPIDWVEENVKFVAPNEEKREKLLMGLNFYGMDYTPIGGGPIVGHDYVKKLESFKGKLNYDVVSEENFVEITDDDGKHIIFYPSLQSIQKRIQLAEALGTGLSIWEIGQGLDYFYDLL